MIANIIVNTTLVASHFYDALQSCSL